jgi:hypothetical protein
MILDRFMAPHGLCRTALLAGLVAMAPATHARAGEVVDMHYDVEIAGTRILELGYRLDLDKAGYQSALSVDSRGILDLFSSIAVDMQVVGRFIGAGIEPVSFQMGSAKQGKGKQASIVWGPGKVPAARRSYELPRQREQAIAQALTTGMPDPLTALLRQGVLAGSSPCTGTERVFNGAEVYDLAFTVDKNDSFSSSDGGVYRGPAIKCLVTYRPVAGLSHKKTRKNLKDPPRFNIWFAPVATRSKGIVYVPVAAAGTFKGKTFVARADHATLGGAPLNAQSLARQ